MDFDLESEFEKLAILRDESEFEYTLEAKKLRDRATNYGYTKTEFDSLVKSFFHDLNKIDSSFSGGEVKIEEGEPHEFNGFEFFTTYRIVADKIYQEYELVISHPIYISKRLIDSETATEKVVLTFRPNKRWLSVTVDKSTIASNTKITALSDYGISVTSENARAVVSYLQEVDTLNYSRIPIVKATATLGWTDDDEFIPYSEKLEFSGDSNLKPIFDSVKTQGSNEEWLQALKTIRNKSLVAKVAIASAVASPLLEILGIDTAFTHIWSTKSGSGKSLLAMACASIWGNPESGHYMQSFNSTTVAIERYAETLKNLPLVLDELQLTSKFNGQHTFSVYNLASGQGKGRGRRDGGIQRQGTWRLMVITTGESPIVNPNDGQGAYARTIEIELKDQLVDFTEGNALANTFRENYGFGGLEIIKAFKAGSKQRYRDTYQQLGKYLIEVSQGELHDKQLMTATAILMGDYVACSLWGGEGILLDEILSLLTSKQESSVEYRAIEVINDWININRKRFKTVNELGFIDTYEDPRELAGYIENDIVYFIPSVLRNEVLKNEVNNYRSTLSALADIGVIEHENGRNTVRKRFENGQQRYNAYDLEKARELLN